MSRDIKAAAVRLKDASPEEIQMIAAHDWDMIREVASIAFAYGPTIGNLPDRECFWLVERNCSPPQYVSLNSAGWHPDPWQARRFNTERDAHDYWRMMGEIDRPQFKVIEHMFVNKP